MSGLAILGWVALGGVITYCCTRPAAYRRGYLQGWDDCSTGWKAKGHGPTCARLPDNVPAGTHLQHAPDCPACGTGTGPHRVVPWAPSPLPSDKPVSIGEVVRHANGGDIRRPWKSGLPPSDHIQCTIPMPPTKPPRAVPLVDNGHSVMCDCDDCIRRYGG